MSIRVKLLIAFEILAAGIGIKLVAAYLNHSRLRFTVYVIAVLLSSGRRVTMPDGLKREEASIGARILTVVDCFDTPASDRPYRKALPLSSIPPQIVECTLITATIRSAARTALRDGGFQMRIALISGKKLGTGSIQSDRLGR
jgi:hypothetical protein